MEEECLTWKSDNRWPKVFVTSLMARRHITKTPVEWLCVNFTVSKTFYAIMNKATQTPESLLFFAES